MILYFVLVTIALKTIETRGISPSFCYLSKETNAHKHTKNKHNLITTRNTLLAEEYCFRRSCHARGNPLVTLHTREDFQNDLPHGRRSLDSFGTNQQSSEDLNNKMSRRPKFSNSKNKEKGRWVRGGEGNYSPQRGNRNFFNRCMRKDSNEETESSVTDEIGADDDENGKTDQLRNRRWARTIGAEISNVRNETLAAIKDFFDFKTRLEVRLL